MVILLDTSVLINGDTIGYFSTVLMVILLDTSVLINGDTIGYFSTVLMVLLSNTSVLYFSQLLNGSKRCVY